MNELETGTEKIVLINANKPGKLPSPKIFFHLYENFKFLEKQQKSANQQRFPKKQHHADKSAYLAALI
jgi:hypothetical protein